MMLKKALEAAAIESALNHAPTPDQPETKMPEQYPQVITALLQSELFSDKRFNREKIKSIFHNICYNTKIPHDILNDINKLYVFPSYLTSHYLAPYINPTEQEYLSTFVITHLQLMSKSHHVSNDSPRGNTSPTL
jgi:hypothetical protein